MIKLFTFFHFENSSFFFINEIIFNLKTFLEAYFLLLAIIDIFNTIFVFISSLYKVRTISQNTDGLLMLHKHCIFYKDENKEKTQKDEKNVFQKNK